jgi:hypothetical protein
MTDAISIGAIIVAAASAIGSIFAAIHFKLNSKCCSCCSCEAYQRSLNSSRSSTIKKYETKETAITVEPTQSLA